MLDMGLRDWLLILGPLVIAGVLVHGYWKMNRGKLKMSLDKEFESEIGDSLDSDVEDLSLLRAELPNGGARIVNRILNSNTEEQSESPADLNLEEDVPVLMDSVQVEPEAVDPESSQLEFESLIPDEPLVKTATKHEDSRRQKSPVKEQSKKPSKEPRPERLFIVNVFPRKDNFAGQQLLETLVNSGFQFGEMDIFHYMDQTTNSPLFSLVNAVEPGTFDLNTMDQMITPGVSLFIKLHELDDPVSGFTRMIEVVQHLAKELDAVIKDATHNSITQQTLDHEIQMVREYSVKYC
jgi:cell division protein ZipA